MTESLSSGPQECTVAVCTRCVMATSDPTVVIGQDGQCNYCTEFDELWLPRWQPDEIGEAILRQQLNLLRRSTASDRYQAVLGVSGGIDSSYLALKAAEWGLRVLAVHVDAGWDTPEALENVDSLISYCGFDYEVVTPRWETIRQLHLAFLRSGIANQDIPQDHAFFTGLYETAHKYRVRTVLSGFNISTEAIASKAWEEPAMDSWLIRHVAWRDGMRHLEEYPLTGLIDYYVRNPYIRKMTVLSPLNYQPYRIDDALAVLKSKTGFIDYGVKHSESFFTRFYQGRYMPERFGIDPRRAHLSNLIHSGEITRALALQKLEEPTYAPALREADTERVAGRLEISRAELESYVAMDPELKGRIISQALIRRPLKRLQVGVERLRGRRVGRYV